MTESNHLHEKKITREVKNFYEKIQFPGRRPLEQDSFIFYRKFSSLIAEQSGNGGPIRVLDAGCGTGNTSLALAAQFKDVEFVGVDISSTSLDTARKYASENNIANVRFVAHNLLNKFNIETNFDIILCFGVLHHTAHMQKALNNLSSALNDRGTLFLWIYGKYGRYFHALNVQLLSMLLSTASANDDTIDLTREFILKTRDKVIIKNLLLNRSEDPELMPFLTDPTWMADQFLNPNELLLNMTELILMIKNARLNIAEWIGIKRDISEYFDSVKLQNCFKLLSHEQQFVALDLLLKMDRYFLMLNKIDPKP